MRQDAGSRGAAPRGAGARGPGSRGAGSRSDETGSGEAGPRALIADDQSLFRRGLARILIDAGISIVGEASDGYEAIQVYARELPDVLIIDLRMPNMDGLDAVKEIAGSHRGARMLVLSAFADIEHATRALRAGALGFLSKNASAEDLVEAVTSVARGERYLPPSLSRELAEVLLGDRGDGLVERLTDREFQVLCLIASGVPNQAIASQLSINPKTVDSHRRAVLRKLGLGNNADLARYAVRHGLVE